VGERLSFEATANLSFEEVDQILRFHLNYLHAKGIELNGTALQDDGGAVLVDEDDALGWVMMQAEEYDIDLEETHAVEIVDAQMEYLSGIGAVGRPAPEPADFSETDDSETDDSGADD
jgi:HJR/Mrr/RecB family endonuclease